MPRVTTHKKNRGGKAATYSCVRCSEPIEPGQTYHEWSFRYGGTRRQHTEHGRPRQSQLTQSKMSEVWAAVEECEDAGDDLSALADAAEALAETVGSVADEYEEAAEPFGGQGENQERADALRDWQSEVEDAASTIRTAADAAEEIHNVEVDEDSEGPEPFTVTCSCGWSGDRYTTEPEALAAADEHKEEVEDDGDVEDAKSKLTEVPL